MNHMDRHSGYSFIPYQLLDMDCEKVKANEDGGDLRQYWSFEPYHDKGDVSNNITQVTESSVPKLHGVYGRESRSQAEPRNGRRIELVDGGDYPSSRIQDDGDGFPDNKAPRFQTFVSGLRPSTMEARECDGFQRCIARDNYPEIPNSDAPGCNEFGGFQLTEPQDGFPHRKSGKHEKSDGIIHAEDTKKSCGFPYEETLEHGESGGFRCTGALSMEDGFSSREVVGPNSLEGFPRNDAQESGEPRDFFCAKIRMDSNREGFPNTNSRVSGHRNKSQKCGTLSKRSKVFLCMSIVFGAFVTALLLAKRHSEIPAVYVGPFYDSVFIKTFAIPEFTDDGTVLGSEKDNSSDETKTAGEKNLFQIDTGGTSVSSNTKSNSSSRNNNTTRAKNEQENTDAVTTTSSSDLVPRGYYIVHGHTGKRIRRHVAWHDKDDKYPSRHRLPEPISNDLMGRDGQDPTDEVIGSEDGGQQVLDDDEIGPGTGGRSKWREAEIGHGRNRKLDEDPKADGNRRPEVGPVDTNRDNVHDAPTPVNVPKVNTVNVITDVLVLDSTSSSTSTVQEVATHLHDTTAISTDGKWDPVTITTNTIDSNTNFGTISTRSSVINDFSGTNSSGTSDTTDMDVDAHGVTPPYTEDGLEHERKPDTNTAEPDLKTGTNNPDGDGQYSTHYGGLVEDVELGTTASSADIVGIATAPNDGTGSMVVDDDAVPISSTTPAMEWHTNVYQPRSDERRPSTTDFPIGHDLWLPVIHPHPEKSSDTEGPNDDHDSNDVNNDDRDPNDVNNDDRDTDDVNKDDGNPDDVNNNDHVPDDVKNDDHDPDYVNNDNHCHDDVNNDDRDPDDVNNNDRDPDDVKNGDRDPDDQEFGPTEKLPNADDDMWDIVNPSHDKSQDSHEGASMVPPDDTSSKCDTSSSVDNSKSDDHQHGFYTDKILTEDDLWRSVIPSAGQEAYEPIPLHWSRPNKHTLKNIYHNYHNWYKQWCKAGKTCSTPRFHHPWSFSDIFKGFHGSRTPGYYGFGPFQNHYPFWMYPGSRHDYNIGIFGDKDGADASCDSDRSVADDSSASKPRDDYCKFHKCYFNGFNDLMKYWKH